MVATQNAPVSREAERAVVARKQGALEIVREIVKDVGETDLPGLAAEMAYHSLFALFSFLLLLAGLVAVSDDVFGINDMRERLVSSAQDVLPQNASAVVEGVVIVFRGAFVDGLDDFIGRGAAELMMAAVVWPLALLVVALAAAVLYWKGPDRDEAFRWVTPGALLFATGWVVASTVASIYLS